MSAATITSATTYGKHGLAFTRVHRAKCGEAAHAETIELDLDLKGDFARAFTHGENSKVVATDSLRILAGNAARHVATWSCASYIEALTKELLERYSQVDQVSSRMRLTRMHETSDNLLVASTLGSVLLDTEGTRTAGSTPVSAKRAGFQISVVKGGKNSFSGFFRDDITQLPDDDDRDLFLDLEVHWSPQPSVKEAELDVDRALSIARLYLSDSTAASIQQLLYGLGVRLLDTLEHAAVMRLAGLNRCWTSLTDSSSICRTYALPLGSPGAIEVEVSRADEVAPCQLVRDLAES